MSRVAITLDQHALAELQKRAAANNEAVSRTAARLVRDGLLSTQADQSPPQAEEPSPSQRPAWLEPLSERERWRRELWATVAALLQRYPHALGSLPGNWYADRAITETLAALGAWRAQLDAGSQPDPRAELLFHDRLEILQRQLTHTGDPTAARFAGGPPPVEWVS